MPCINFREGRKKLLRRYPQFARTLIGKINANIYRKYKVKQAIEIIRRARREFGELAVAFSGGKDSLVALHLTLQVSRRVAVIFNNTTAEFPETVEYVCNLAEKWGLDLYMTLPREPLFTAVKRRGWASHRNRWCCTFCKDGPTNALLRRLGIVAEVTGLSRTDSMYRRYLSPLTVYKSDSLIRVNPLYDWNEHEVWEYIRSHKLPYNPLYDKGYRRVGCWCCPLNGITHYSRLRRTHPQLFSFLENFHPQHPALGSQ